MRLLRNGLNEWRVYFSARFSWSCCCRIIRSIPITTYSNGWNFLCVNNPEISAININTHSKKASNVNWLLRKIATSLTKLKNSVAPGLFGTQQPCLQCLFYKAEQLRRGEKSNLWRKLLQILQQIFFASACISESISEMAVNPS